MTASTPIHAIGPEIAGQFERLRNRERVLQNARWDVEYHKEQVLVKKIRYNLTLLDSDLRTLEYSLRELSLARTALGVLEALEEKIGGTK